MTKNIILIVLFLAMGIALTSNSLYAQAGIDPVATITAGNLRDFQFLSQNTGWVLIENQLFYTEDGGVNWQNIAPNSDGELRAVRFLNESQGVMITTSTINSYRQHLLGYTQDAGQTWSFSEIVSYPDTSPYFDIESVYPFFLDSQTGWVTLKIKTSSNFSAGKLFVTTNGGKTWDARTIPLGEPVYFINQEVGFTAGGAAKQEFFRTSDGGYTWEKIPITKSSETITTTPHFSSLTKGYLPMFENTAEGTAVIIMRTDNQGLSWEQIDSSVISSSQDFLAPTAVSENTLHILTLDQMLNYNFATSTLQITARESRSNLAKFQMLTNDLGWAIDSTSLCSNLEDASTCDTQKNLVSTQDGGISWQLVQTPNVTVSTYLLEDRIEPRTAIYLNDRTDLMIGQGIDMCEISGLYQLQTWKNSSPYNAVNLYIGGVSRACPNTNLSVEFLTTLSKQGWKFIPTWVGHQASCSIYTNKMSSSTSTAYDQGVDNAIDAARVAYKLGLKDQYSPGTIIYYDLEAFDTTNTQCLNAAKAFINGWVTKLHEEGITAGVYGSVCASGLSDYYTIANPPDVIWAARWTSDTYYSAITPDSLPCISDSMWGNHQRILQYTGAHIENWGGVSLNIDVDTIDGIVADLSQYVGVPAQPLQNPSFESGSLTPWAISPNETACDWTLSNNSDNARTGDYALLLNKTTNQPDCFGAVQNIPVSPTAGQKYRFAIWARSASSSSLRSLRLSITGTGLTPESTSYKFSGISDTWSCIEVDHTITKNGLTGIQVAVKLENEDGIDLHLDDAHLAVGTSSLCPTILTPTNIKASYSTYTDHIVLDWDSVPESTFYRILRAASPNEAPERIGVSSTPEYVDESLGYDETFTYWVQACTPNKCSAESDYAIGATAPLSALFSDGFETGSLNYWSAFVNKTALDVCTNGAIFDSYSLCIDTVPGEIKYATYNLGTPFNDMTVEFWLDPNSAEFDQITILRGNQQTTGETNFQVALKNESGYKIQYQVQSNNVWQYSDWYPIANAPNLIKINWNSTVIQGRAVLDFTPSELWINTLLMESISTGISFGQLTDQIHFGAISAPTTGEPSNTIILDEFSSILPIYRRPLRVP